MIMNKFISYDGEASALELAKVYTAAKQRRLKLVYELKFVFGQELLELHNVIQQMMSDIEHMAKEAKLVRQVGDEHAYHTTVN